MNINNCFLHNSKIALLVLYVFAMFFTSADDQLRIFSMTPYNVVAFLMIIMSIVTALYAGKMTFKLPNELRSLYILFFWIILSLVISKLDNTKQIIDEVYNYDWAIGANSPAIRGLSFITRFILSAASILFITNTVNNKMKYMYITRLFIIAFGLFMIFPVIQLVLIYLLKIEIGNIYYDGSTRRARIGSFVGEPSVLAGMLCCGIFPLLSAIINYNCVAYFNKYTLKMILAVALIILLFTSSASVIIAMAFTLIFYVRKYISKKVWLLLVAALILLSLVSSSVQQIILLKFMSELSTVNIRSLSWIVGFNSLLQHPLTGLGIGQAPFFVAPFLPDLSDIPFDINENFKFTEGRYTPMNTYLEFATETGIVGLLLLFVFVYDIYKYQKNKNKSSEERFVQFAFGAGLFAIAISMNSFPGGLYLGYLNFMVGMYIAGLKIYSSQNSKGISF